MKVFHLEFHSDTAIDYDEAYSWYEERSEGLGERFLADVRDIINVIVANPEIFSVKSKKGYREAKLDDYPYTVAYKILRKRKVVFISSIHHQARHPRMKYREPE